MVKILHRPAIRFEGKGSRAWKVCYDRLVGMLISSFGAHEREPNWNQIVRVFQARRASVGRTIFLPLEPAAVMAEGEQRAQEARQGGRQRSRPTAVLKAKDAPASPLDSLPVGVRVVAKMTIETQNQPRPTHPVSSPAGRVEPEQPSPSRNEAGEVLRDVRPDG
jgi:hypothetical protein